MSVTNISPAATGFTKPELNGGVVPGVPEENSSKPGFKTVLHKCMVLSNKNINCPRRHAYVRFGAILILKFEAKNSTFVLPVPYLLSVAAEQVKKQPLPLSSLRRNSCQSDILKQKYEIFEKQGKAKAQLKRAVRRVLFHCHASWLPTRATWLSQ